jgi:hypothetical protein
VEIPLRGLAALAALNGGDARNGDGKGQAAGGAP